MSDMKELNDNELEQVIGGAFGYYTVKFGDTLEDIAEKVGNTVSQLISLNGISYPDKLIAGSILKYKC